MDEGRDIKKKLTIAMVVFVVILIASFVLLYFVSKKQSALEGADSSVRLSAQSGFSCEFAEAQKLYPFCDGVIKIANDRVAYLTSSGSEVYSYPVNYMNPVCYIRNGYCIVADIDGYSFSVYDAKNQIFIKSTDEKIKACYLSDQCFSAVILDSKDAYGEVMLCDPNGAFIAECISNDSGFPVSCVFNDDSSMIAITTVNTNGAVVKPYIKLLKIEYDRKRYTADDHAVYSIEDSEILSSICFSKDRFVTFSSDSAYLVGDKDVAKLELGFGSFNCCFTVGDNLFIIYSDGVGRVNKLAVIDSGNNIVYDSLLGSTVNAYGTDGDRAVISVDRRIFVFGSDGNVVSDISVDEDVLKVGFIGSDKIIVVSTSGVHTYNY